LCAALVADLSLMIFESHRDYGSSAGASPTRQSIWNFSVAVHLAARVHSVSVTGHGFSCCWSALVFFSCRPWSLSVKPFSSCRCWLIQCVLPPPDCPGRLCSICKITDWPFKFQSQPQELSKRFCFPNCVMVRVG
jgi:hypothetical protein